MSFVYLHHSCGRGFPDEGGMSAKLTAMGLDVHSITYGDGWIGGNTNSDHFPKFSQWLKTGCPRRRRK